MACECDCMMLKTIQRLVRRQRILEEHIMLLESELENMECMCNDNDA